MKTSETILDHVYSSLCGCEGIEASKKLKELATYYGVATSTVCAWAKKRGLRWRKERATKGTSKVPKKALDAAAALVLVSKRTSSAKEMPLPSCDAKEILEDSGYDTGGVSTDHFLNLMRKKQISAKHFLRPTPHVILLSKHPNHVWQFDVTNCLQYFLDTKNGMGERDWDMELYKNKIVKTAKEIKKELLRYAVVDHCSGAFYFRYFEAAGELAIHGAQFLYEAMRPKDELIKKYWNGEAEPKLGKYHFHGVPFKLVADRGSIMKAKQNQILFDSLRVELEPHLPGNPRAKGGVEGLMHIINRFEGRLKFERPESLFDLNKKALDWCIGINAVKIFREVAPRSALWATIKGDELRNCPEEKLYRMLIKEPIVRRKTNGARIVNLDGLDYLIPDPNAVYQWVDIVRHPYEYPAIEVYFNGYVWLLQPIGKDMYGRLTVGVPYGEYRGIKYTETQKAKVELEKTASDFGITWKGTGDKRRSVAPPLGFQSPLKVFGHQAEKAGNIEFLPKKGVELEIKEQEMPENKPMRIDAIEIARDMEQGARRISITEFLKRLVREIGPITPEMNQELRAKYGESIEIEEAERAIGEMQSAKCKVQNYREGVK